MNFGELIIELHRNSLYELKKITKTHDITISQLLCIVSIPYDGITQSSLTKKLSLDISTLSRNLEKLLKRKILIKELHVKDRRMSKIYLTQMGKKINLNIISTFNHNLINFNNTFDEKEFQNVLESLTQLNWFFMQNQLHDQ